MAQDPKEYRTPGHERPDLLADPLAMFCLGCRYPLRGLTGGVCPECGRAFDPKDATTYAPTARRWSWVVPVDGAGAVLFALPMAYLLLESWLGTGHRWWWRHGDINVFVCPLFVIGLVAWGGLKLYVRPQHSMSDVLLVGIVGFGFVLTAMGGGNALTLYTLAMSFALGMILSLRAWRTAAWKSQQMAALAMLVSGLGVIALLTQIPLHNADIYDYWTYWFWTPQR